MSQRTNAKMAGVPGFEPGNGGTKNRCLTTWLHPKRGHTDSTKAEKAQVSKRSDGLLFSRIKDVQSAMSKTLNDSTQVALTRLSSPENCAFWHN